MSKIFDCRQITRRKPATTEKFGHRFSAKQLFTPNISIQVEKLHRWVVVVLLIVFHELVIVLVHIGCEIVPLNQQENAQYECNHS